MMAGFQENKGKLRAEKEGKIAYELVGAKNAETGKEEKIIHEVDVLYVPGAVQGEIIVPLKSFKERSVKKTKKRGQNNLF